VYAGLKGWVSQQVGLNSESPSGFAPCPVHITHHKVTIYFSCPQICTAKRCRLAFISVLALKVAAGEQ